MGLAIGVDVGGTKIAAGVVDDSGGIVTSTRRDTPRGGSDEVAQAIAEVVDELRSKEDVTGEIEAIGLGAAGFIDRDRATVLFAPNLAWRNEPLQDAVANRTGLPTVVENDANATAWGEYRYGAGRGQDDLVCLTVGTGIGGGIVIAGALYRGRFGIGAEVGHIRVVPNGRRCGCGNRGCWEQYCSGRALVWEAREIATVDPRYGARLLEMGGGVPEGITGEHVTQAAKDGDEAARECFDVIGTWLGQGMADLAAVLDPGRFVIGGGVSDAGDLLLEPAIRAYGEALTGHGYRPEAEVLQAELGGAAGLVGAADLARQPAAQQTKL